MARTLAAPPRRGLGARLAVLVVLATGLAVLVTVAVVVAAFQQKGCGGGGAFAPSGAAEDGIPASYLALYRRAGAEYGLDWAVLAGIGAVETDHGRLRAPGVLSGENFAGAGGPMQFLASTWARYGVDGDGDGDRDRYDPRDAIPTAANYLVASGAPDDYRGALFAYNHAGWYVDDVLERAARYRGNPQAGEGPARACGGSALAVDGASIRALLGNPRVVFADPQMEADLRAGRIDPRIVGLLEAIGRRHRVTVTSLLRPADSGSNHSAGRAVDIGAVDGESCFPPARRGACGRLLAELEALEGRFAPTELIYAFDLDPADPSSFADPLGHADHIHVGFDGPL